MSPRPTGTASRRYASCSKARAPPPPSMTWHDHANETSEPMFWLDGLDIPMVQFFDASFAEGSNEDQQKITRPPGDSFARYGHNLLPVDEKRTSKTSPIFNYPYNYTREALENAKARD